MIITTEDRTAATGLLLEVPFGLAVVDPTSGLILEMNRAAARLLGLSPGASASLRDIVAGDGTALLHSLEQIGFGRSSRFAFRRRARGSSERLIHGWACRVGEHQHSLVYCAFLRPDADLGPTDAGLDRVALLEKVVTAAPDIIYVQDAGRKRDLFISGAWRSLGYSREELQALSGPFTEVLAHPADRARLRVAPGNGGPVVTENDLRVRHRDGGYRLLRCRETAVFVTPQHGQPQVVGYAEDVTEQRKQLAQVRESEGRARARAAELEVAAVRLSVADRRKDEFLAQLAHELRNPLAPIRIWTQRLRRAEEVPALVKHASEVVDRQVRHLTRLVEDLLEVSRFVWGKVALRNELVLLTDAIELAVQMAQPLIEERRHELTVSLGMQVVWVKGDLARLVEIFHNLLDNAAKYTPAGGRIALSLTVGPTEAVVQVRDNGIGIEPDFMPRVFDLFARGPHADNLPAGLGLGLSLVHQMVVAHGGTVTARSPGTSQGSEFEVRLPVAAPPELTSPASAAEVPANHAAHRILVVDDNADGAEALASYLKDQGHAVEVAGDGPGALAAAEQLRPEFVFLDIGMPGMDGHEVARRLRAEPWARDVVLVAVSGYDSEEDRQRSLAAGCNEHLVKPVDPEAIVALLSLHSAGRNRPQGDDA